jgi:hypothetical protein
VPNYSFTITQVVYDFTATVTTPVNLVLNNTETQVLITGTTATIQVINNIQPVSVGAGSGQIFNQNLNTTDNVSFASLTTPYIYGFAQQPVVFPTGIIAGNFSSLDFQNPGDPAP